MQQLAIKEGVDKTQALFFCCCYIAITIQQQGDYEGIVRLSSRVATQVYDLNIED